MTGQESASLVRSLAFLFAGLVASCTSLVVSPTTAHSAKAQGQQPASGMEQMDMDHDQSAGMIEAMRPHEQHRGPHMRWTTLRPANPADDRRAEELVEVLRRSIAKYRDYRVALDEGFVLAHPERKAKHYHFGNKQRRQIARIRFDPALPTTLLYKKTADGYELEGAMYTAPKGMTEDELNQRIPLSVAQWHAHVNLCLEPDDSGRRMKRRQFGFKGTIATESECRQAGGRFVEQAGGWMIHVYPFESTSAKIWTH
ncbi:MAG TPA: hypothetical protein VFS39_18670 [Nitrospira sp.]|nr:hypothetical protein [Nitrospira sp.]